MIPDTDCLGLDKGSRYSDLGFGKESVYSEHLSITDMLAWSHWGVCYPKVSSYINNFINLKFITTFHYQILNTLFQIR